MFEKQASSEIAQSRELCEFCGCEVCQCDPDDDPLEDAMMDCGMMHDGTCSKAGSEECDWDCPFSR